MLLEWHSSIVGAIRKDRVIRLLIQRDCQEHIQMSLDLFHDVDTVTKIALWACVLIDVSLTAHLVSNHLDFLDR